MINHHNIRNELEISKEKEEINEKHNFQFLPAIQSNQSRTGRGDSQVNINEDRLHVKQV